MKKLITTAAISILGASLLVGCNQQSSATPQSKVTQAQKAKQVANSIKFTENAEIDNIKKRLELTSNPGALGYIVLMNQAGQPVMYTSVKGKVTSSGKRLTNPQRKVNDRYDMSHRQHVMVAPSDEGTWGSSSPYIYFWDTNGAYHQWNDKYLYSDQPIRLSVKPLVINVEVE